MTQTVCRALFAGLLGLSVLFTAMPMPAVMAAVPAKSNCCAKSNGPQNDCGKHAPKSSDDRECCVACATCLTLFLSSQQSLNYSPKLAWILALTSVREKGRTERPSVPPPRAAVV